MKPSSSRRSEDRLPGTILIVASSREESGADYVTVAEYGTSRFTEGVDGTEAPLVLVNAGDSDLLVLTGAELHRHRRKAGEPLSEVVACEVRALQGRLLAARRRRRFCDGFVTFTEQLNRAEDEPEVCHALVEWAAELMDMGGAYLFLRSDGGRGGLRPFCRKEDKVRIGALAPHALPMSEPRVIARSETERGCPFEGLGPLYDAGAARLACTPIGDRGILVLVERRLNDEFGGDDWFRLKSIGRQAGATLERLTLRRRLNG